MVGVITAKYAAGKVTQADVLQAQVERSMLIERRLELAEMLHRARYRAASALGRDPSAAFVAAAPPSIEGRVDELEALWKGAQPRAPRLLMARAKITETAAGARVAEGMAGYDVTLTAQYGQRDDGEMERPDMASVMASVSVPLWRAAKQDRLIKGARFAERAAHDELAGEELRLRSELASKLAGVRRERETIRLYDTGIIPQGAQTFESSMAAYRVDKLESMAVIGAELGLLKYQLAREEAQRRLRERYAEIDALTGADFTGSEP
ncbi:MAG: TolC family protein [Nitrospinae bacterium]|nr:TolC family protein [Nitrospinota bacterium]